MLLKDQARISLLESPGLLSRLATGGGVAISHFRANQSPCVKAKRPRLFPRAPLCRLRFRRRCLTPDSLRAFPALWHAQAFGDVSLSLAVDERRSFVSALRAFMDSA